LRVSVKVKVKVKVRVKVRVLWDTVQVRVGIVLGLESDVAVA